MEARLTIEKVKNYYKFNIMLVIIKNILKEFYISELNYP
jgi:hypothetical protein